MDEDAVLYAATLAHGTENPIKYIDKIVKNWSMKGINTLEKAKAEMPPAKEGTNPAKNNPSKIMDERDIKDEDYSNWFNIELKHGHRAGE